MKKFLGAFSMMMSASAALAQGSPDVIPLGWISKSYLSCSTHHNCVVADQSATASKIRSTPNGHPIGTIQNKVPVVILDQSGLGFSLELILGPVSQVTTTVAI